MNDSSFHPVILAPTYNNAPHLLGVLHAIEPIGCPILVVDDGCTDGSSALLDAWAAERPATRRVIHHAKNAGKAAALRTGFAAARAAGYTHAATMDTDGQLDAADLAKLIELARADPAAMVVGRRDDTTTEYPGASRAGRRISNTLVRWESGLRVSDTQCGLRVYPLAALPHLRASAERFGFETEVLASAGFAGLRLVEENIVCRYEVPGGRITHFKKWRDSFAAVRMHARLLARSLFTFGGRRLDPTATSGTMLRRFLRWLNPMEAWRAAGRDGAGRSRFAAAVAVGVFLGVTPFFGLHAIFALLVARWLRLPPLPTLLGSNISIPPLGPVIWFAALSLGNRVLHGAWPTAEQFDASDIGILALLGDLAWEWVVGSFLLGIAMAIVTYAFVEALLLGRTVWRRWRD